MSKLATIFPSRLLLIFLFFPLLLACSFAKEIEEANGEQFTARDRTLVRVVTILLQNYHYANPTIDDEVSRSLFQEYIEYLDPNRYFFLARDIDKFSPYKEKLDDQLQEGSPEFAFKVYKLYLKRIQERLDYVKTRLDQPFDFYVDEKLLIDREKAPWAKSVAELDEIWRLQIKNQLLQAKLQDKLAEEEKENNNEKGKQTNDNSQAPETESEHQRKSPKERILKRYQRLYDYAQENDKDDIIEGYLSSLARIFDPHSGYLNHETYENFQISLRLSLQGIGAVLTSEDGYCKIVRIVPGGPADKQGELKAGYRIIAVAQEGEEPENVVDMPLSDVVQKIRGEKGTKVTLTVIKTLQGAPFDITIVRDKVKLTEQAAKGEVKEVSISGKSEKIGIIKLPSFYTDFEGIRRNDPNARSTVRDVKKLVEKMYREDKISGLIIDLRYNGGGSLDEVVSLSDLFIPRGPVVQIKDSRGKIEVRRGDDNGFAYSVPLLVMVNTFSASASEIFAGVIQDYGRGVVVGQRTHGKGTVQNLLDLKRIPALREANLGALKYTMAKFYRVTGASTQKKGVLPDVLFPSIATAEEYGEESLEHVMKWDEIAPLDFKRTQRNVDPHIEKIRLAHRVRREKNERFQTLIKYIEHWNERKEQKEISLHFDTRLQNQRQENEWFEKIQEMIGREDSASVVEAEQGVHIEDQQAPEQQPEQEEQENKEEEKQSQDLYLQEATLILKDLIESLQNN